MKITPHTIFITFLFACLLLLQACAGNTQGPWNVPVYQDGKPIAGPVGQPYDIPKGTVNVALLLPLSGSNAALGHSMLQAAQLALFELNQNNFNLMPRDTNGTALGAASAAQSAIQDGAQIILGPVFANSVRAVKPIVSQRGIKMIAFSTDWTLADRNTYLMGFMPFSQVDRIAEYTAQKGYRDAAIISGRDEYGNLVTSRFQKSFQSNGGSITNIVRVNPNDPDLGTQIASVNKNSKAVFIPIGGKSAVAVGDFLSQNSMPANKTKRIGTGLWDNNTLASSQGLQGAWFAAPSPNGRVYFERLYESTYGQKPVRIATLAFDATALAVTLAQNGNNSFTAKNITNPNGFSGTDGIFRFGTDGIVQRKLAVLELRNSQIIEIDPAALQF